MEKITLASLKFLSLPLGTLLVTTLLVIVSFKLFTGRLGVEQANLGEANSQQSILTKKKNTLQSIGSVLGNTQSISFALPGENPSFVTLAQIRRYLGESGLTLNSIQSGQEIADKQDLSHTNINFDAEGSYISIFALVDKLKNAAPITVGNSITINQKGGSTLASFTLSTYWSPLPSKLPPLTEPVSDLTNDEKEILSRISLLDLPIITTVPQEATVGGTATTSGAPKTNPFGM